MIRRGFWLVTGAITGIYGYRRVAAVGRRVSATLGPRAALGPGAAVGQKGQKGQKPALDPKPALARGAKGAKEAFRFARDVREGMELYLARHDRPSGSTLTTDHDLNQPEDGH
jgi:hypothetical protein